MTDDVTLTVRRVIAATPARLFEAWTTPALLRVWWGPRDVRCMAAEVDLRVGGNYRLGNQLPDGRVVWITGTFELIEPPHRLVYSWRIGDEPTSRVTVRFDPAERGTEVTVVQSASCPQQRATSTKWAGPAVSRDLGRGRCDPRATARE